MVQWPVAVFTHADQVLLPIFVKLRQRQVRPLPERVDVMDNTSSHDFRALPPEEVKLVRVGVAIALVVLIPLDLPP